MQEGHHFDLKPELDVVGILQVFLGQRLRVHLAKDLLKVGRHLLEVLQDEKGGTD